VTDIDSSLALPVGPLALAGFRVAEVTTGHITEADDQILREHKDCGPKEHPQVILVYEHGFFVSTWHNGVDNPEKFENLLLAVGHSPAYVNLVMIAYRAGAKWLNLDCDGTDYGWLPSYAW